MSRPTNPASTRRERPRASTPRGHRAPRHEIVCADCATGATVPFRPIAGRPVYCRKCFEIRRQQNEPATSGAGPDHRRIDAPSKDADARSFQEMDLGAATQAAIAAMGIVEPTPIQAKSIPHLLAGRDLTGQARTGSGKTLAFAVPIAERCNPSLKRAQALVLVPTRELAIQVHSVIETVAASSGLDVQSLYGGRSIRPEHASLRRGPQVIVGTPGRTLDHLRQGNLDLGAVRFLVLDEADEMLDKGFARDVEAIIARTPGERQTALFSATMPRWVANTAKQHLREPRKVEIDSDVQAPPTVAHKVFAIEKPHKIQALQTVLDDGEGAIIVFARTKHGVKKLARQLDAAGYLVGALQGNLSQNARERVLAAFRSGEVPVLVATNVAARGIDVEGVDQIVNYDLPDSQQLFTHRVGRTGRMGRSGEAITFVTPDEKAKWREIERGLGERIRPVSWRPARDAEAA